MARIIKPARREFTVTTEPVESVPMLPQTGDEVLFNTGARWILAEVVGQQPNGDLVLLCDLGGELVSQRATHSTAEHGWLTYTEAAKHLTSQ